jgi:hypothetical protein
MGCDKSTTFNNIIQEMKIKYKRNLRKMPKNAMAKTKFGNSAPGSRINV